MAWVYVPYSRKIDKYYLGACTDLDRRLYEHNLGHSKFTSTRVPWKLVFKEEFQDLILAKQRESKIKKMKSRPYLEGLILKGSPGSAGRASRF
jgi:putative endonuclease